MSAPRGESRVVTLPSNACMKMYPSNKTTSYQVQLPQTMDLTDGQYEVGLTGFHYPRSWYNFPRHKRYQALFMMDESASGMAWCQPPAREELPPAESELWDEVPPQGGAAADSPDEGETEGEIEGEIDGEEARVKRVVKSLYKTRRTAVRPGHYTSADEILDLINPRVKVGANFVYNAARRKMSLSFRPGLNGCVYKVVMSGPLAEKLGWPPEDTTVYGSDNDLVEAPRIFCLDHIDLIYVHCDMAADAHMVGDVTNCLLRTVPTSGEHGAVVTYEPRRVDWFPVRTSQFRTVQVLITDGFGKKIPFESGTCSVKLLLRRMNAFAS